MAGRVTAIPAFVRSELETPGDIRPRPYANCYWLVPGRLLAGEHPGSIRPGICVAKLDALLDSGVRRFIDLTGEREREPSYLPILLERAALRAVVVRHQRFAIPDFGVPTIAVMRAALDAIYDAHAAGDLVYLHCWGGVGRTGTVVGCLLREQGMTAAEALTLISRKWLSMEKRPRYPSSPETSEQIEFIEQWHGALIARSAHP